MLLDFPETSADVFQHTMQEFIRAWTAQHGKPSLTSTWAKELEDQWDKVFTYQVGSLAPPGKVMWKSLSPTATNNAEHVLSFNLLGTIHLLRFCSCPNVPKMSDQWHERQRFLFGAITSLLTAYDVNLNRVISPTGRDLWMQLSMTSMDDDVLKGRSSVLGSTAVFQTLLDLGLDLTARLDHSGHGLLTYLSTYSRVPQQELIEMLVERAPDEFWKDASLHPVSSGSSTGYPNRETICALHALSQANVLRDEVKIHLADAAKSERTRHKM